MLSFYGFGLEEEGEYARAEDTALAAAMVRRRSRHQQAHGRQPSSSHHEEDKVPSGMIRAALAAA